MKKIFLVLLMIISSVSFAKADDYEEFEFNSAPFWYKVAFSYVPMITRFGTLPPVKFIANQNPKKLPDNDNTKYGRILALFDSSINIRPEMEQICKVNSKEKAQALSEKDKKLLSSLYRHDFLGSIKKAKEKDNCLFYKKRTSCNDNHFPNVFEWGYKIRVIKAFAWYSFYRREEKNAIDLVFNIFEMYDKMEKDGNDYAMLSAVVVKNNLLGLLEELYAVSIEAETKNRIVEFVKDLPNHDKSFKDFISVRKEYILNSLAEFEQNPSLMAKHLKWRSQQYYLKVMSCNNLRLYVEAVFDGFLKNHNGYKEKNYNKVIDAFIDSGLIESRVDCPNGNKFKVHYDTDELGCEIAKITCDCDKIYCGEFAVASDTRIINVANSYLQNDYELHKNEMLSIYDKLLNNDYDKDEFVRNFSNDNIEISKNNDLNIIFGINLIAIKSAYDEYIAKQREFCNKH